MADNTKRSLDELEDALWQEFDVARGRQSRFRDEDSYSYSTEHHPGNYATENRAAIAEVAQAIVAVRREKRIEKTLENIQKIEDEIENGTRREIVAPKLKIKH